MDTFTCQHLFMPEKILDFNFSISLLTLFQKLSIKKKETLGWHKHIPNNGAAFDLSNESILTLPYDICSTLRSIIQHC
jgi:hypothetical protein